MGDTKVGRTWGTAVAVPCDYTSVCRRIGLFIHGLVYSITDWSVRSWIGMFVHGLVCSFMDSSVRTNEGFDIGEQ